MTRLAVTRIGILAAALLIAAVPAHAITRAEIIKLSLQGVPPSDIIARIKADGSTFELHFADVDALTVAGVHPDVVAAMKSAVRPAPQVTKSVQARVETPVLDLRNSFIQADYNVLRSWFNWPVTVLRRSGGSVQGTLKDARLGILTVETRNGVLYVNDPIEVRREDVPLQRAEAPALPLTVEGVIARVRAGASADAVIAEIAKSGVGFRLSSDDMVMLRDAGVPGEVMVAMSTARGRVLEPTPLLDPSATPRDTVLRQGRNAAQLTFLIDEARRDKMAVDGEIHSIGVRRGWAIGLGVGAGVTLIAAFVQSGLNVTHANDLEDACKKAALPGDDCDIEVSHVGEGTTYATAAVMAAISLSLNPWGADREALEERLRVLDQEERTLRSELLRTSLSISPFGAGLLVRLDY